eukprot:SAG31_NODE_2432_length_5706_cov_41.121634_4_plen_88_part_00
MFAEDATVGHTSKKEIDIEPATKRQAIEVASIDAMPTAQVFTENDQEALAMNAAAFDHSRGRRQGLGFASYRANLFIQCDRHTKPRT